MDLDKLAKALAEAVTNALKAGRIKDLENFAEKGSILAQLMLGEMYFFSISADEYYLEDLFQIAAMENAILRNLGKKKLPQKLLPSCDLWLPQRLTRYWQGS